MMRIEPSKDRDVSSRAGNEHRPAFAVGMPYAKGTGYALRTLFASFQDAASRIGKCQHDVVRLFGPTAAEELQDDLEFAFNWSKPSPEELRRLAEFLRSRNVVGFMGLDLQVRTPFLPAMRTAGLAAVIAYWGAPISGLQSPLGLLARRIEVRMQRSGPDHFIFESEAMRALAIGGRGIAATRTSVIPTGIDAERFGRPEGYWRGYLQHTLGISPDRKVIVYSGHFESRKGVDTLVEAAKVLVGEFGRADFHVLLAGNRGSEAARLEAQLDGSAARQFVTFGGYRNDLPFIFKDAYLGCIPSVGWDSFPMSSLEMQAAGLPVVVSDLQGVPETIGIGTSGLVFRAGDAGHLAEILNRVLSDPESRQRMSAEATKRIASGYSRKRQVSRMAAELEQILRKSARPWCRLLNRGAIEVDPLLGL